MKLESDIIKRTHCRLYADFLLGVFRDKPKIRLCKKNSRFELKRISDFFFDF